MKWLLIIVVLIGLANVDGRRDLILKRKSKVQAHDEIVCLDPEEKPYQEKIWFDEVAKALEERKDVHNVVCLDFDGTITKSHTSLPDLEEDTNKLVLGEKFLPIFKAAVEKLRKSAFVGILSNGHGDVIRRYLAKWEVPVDFVSGNKFYQDDEKKVNRIKCVVNYYSSANPQHVVLVDDDHSNCDRLEGSQDVFGGVKVECMRIRKGAQSFLSAAGAQTIEALEGRVRSWDEVVEQEVVGNGDEDIPEVPMGGGGEEEVRLVLPTQVKKDDGNSG
jgi:hypothetical protein